jgi:hypothetical protein
MMYGNREQDYDICGRCINKKYPAPGTLAVQKTVEARKQALKSPGSSMDMSGAAPSQKKKVTSMTREEYAQAMASPEERREMKRGQRSREAEELQVRRWSSLALTPFSTMVISHKITFSLLLFIIYSRRSARTTSRSGRPK